MYDTVRVKAGLPAGSPFDAGTEFQTKGLECDMTHYEVRADGRLVMVMTGWFPPMPCEVVLADYHGDLFLIADVPGTNDYYDYRARFTEGVLTSIIDVTPPKGGE